MKKYIHVVRHHTKTGRTVEYKFKKSEFHLIAKLLEENVWLQVEEKEMPTSEYNLTFDI